VRAEIAELPERRRVALESDNEHEYRRLDFSAKRLPGRIELAAHKAASADIDFWRTIQQLAGRVQSEAESEQSGMVIELREVKRALAASEKCTSPESSLPLSEVARLNERWRQLTAALKPTVTAVRRAEEVIAVCEGRAQMIYSASMRPENTFQRQFSMPEDAILAHAVACKRLAERVLK
jgi:hypothetical protein